MLGFWEFILNLNIDYSTISIGDPGDDFVSRNEVRDKYISSIKLDIPILPNDLIGDIFKYY